MLRLLALFALALCAAGLVAGLVADTWTILPVSLLALGGGLLLVALGLMLRRGLLGARASQAGMNAVVALVSMVAIFGIGNYWAARDAVRLDLTENKLLTLTESTQALLASLDRPLKVWVFDAPAAPQDEQLLGEYQRRKPDFRFEFVNPDRRIDLVRRFDVQAQGEVYVESGDRQQLVQITSESAPLSEVQLSNAIVKLLRERIPTLYFLQGHGEAPLEPGEGGLAQATIALQERGYRVETLNLVERSQVPNDADAIAIFGPQRPLLPGEVEVLRRYLDAGGSLLAAVPPEVEVGLDDLFGDWGVELDERLVVDVSRRGDPIGLGPLVPLVSRYGNHPIVATFGEGLTFYPLSRAVSVTEDAEDVMAEPLAFTHEETWAESDLTSEELSFDPASDRNGPLPLGYALSRLPTSSQDAIAPEESGDPASDATATPQQQAQEQQQPERANAPAPPSQESRLVVFGNAGFATNGWFEQQLNGDMFLNAIDWLTQADAQEQPFLVRPREQTNRRIVLTPLQTNVLSLVALAIVPLLGLTAAALTWFWRR